VSHYSIFLRLRFCLFEPTPTVLTRTSGEAISDPNEADCSLELSFQLSGGSGNV
jgi:hypothetical protein